MTLSAEESTDEEGDNHKHTSKTRSGKASAREKEPAASTKGKPSRKPALTGFARVQKVAFKYLFGWLDPKFKRNGKKLIADNQVVFKFMVSYLSLSSINVNKHPGWAQHHEVDGCLKQARLHYVGK